MPGPLEIGGDNGLRGYPLRYRHGSGACCSRWRRGGYTDWYPLRLFRVGGAVFYDTGRVEGRESQHYQRRLAARRGLRLAPAERAYRKGNVLHADFAFPLDPDPTIDKVQFVVKTSGILRMRSIIVAVLLSLAAPAIAQSENGLTLYAGYRFGGEFTDVNNAVPWEFTDGGSFALSLAKGIDPQRQYEFFVSHRNGALKPFGPLCCHKQRQPGGDLLPYRRNYFPGRARPRRLSCRWTRSTHLDPREAGSIQRLASR